MRSSMPVSSETPLGASLRDYWLEVSSVASAIDQSRLETAAQLLLDCQARGHVIYAIGNGGSAATASHFACDLAKGTRGNGPPTFRVMALTDNVPVLTAWANDHGYEGVFAEQLASLVRSGDLLVAISASGNSPNVIAAVETAHAYGAHSIGLTGRFGGRLAQIASLAVTVPSDRIEVVEDAHLIVAHSLCVAARDHLATARPAFPSSQQLTTLSERRAAG